MYSSHEGQRLMELKRLPSGNKGVREIAHHPGGAVAVPILDDGRVLLVRQLRYPFGKHIYELPAGKLGPGEDPQVAAARELEEETGYVAGSLEHLSTIYTTPGFCDEELHIFLATDLRQSPHGHRREEGEFSMTVQPMLLLEAIEMIEKGEIKDAKTIIGLLLIERRMKGRH
ncbi:MAG: nudix hydrolase [Bacteroidetes bacterium]|nr:nudix hydrolase [Bacteroidota bacterium]